MRWHVKGVVQVPLQAANCADHTLKCKALSCRQPAEDPMGWDVQTRQAKHQKIQWDIYLVVVPVYIYWDAYYTLAPLAPPLDIELRECECAWKYRK